MRVLIWGFVRFAFMVCISCSRIYWRKVIVCERAQYAFFTVRSSVSECGCGREIAYSKVQCTCTRTRLARRGEYRQIISG